MKDDPTIEEIKPDFFIKVDGRGRYKRVYPLSWQGKSRLGKEIKRIFTFRTFFTICLILFIAWSYNHDTKALRDYYKLTQEHRLEFCNNVGHIDLPDCQYNGSLNPDILYKCYNKVGIDLTTIIKKNESSNGLS